VFNLGAGGADPEFGYRRLNHEAEPESEAEEIVRGQVSEAAVAKKMPTMGRITSVSSSIPRCFRLRISPADRWSMIWGGEFGRTPYAQGAPKPDNYGRDHHGRVFSLWMAGGGIKRGHVHGQSDDYGFNVVDGGAHVHDFQATILHLLEIDHQKLTFLFQARQFRLTDVEGRVVEQILA
jgi:hypothetical protein